MSLVGALHKSLGGHWMCEVSRSRQQAGNRQSSGTCFFRRTWGTRISYCRNRSCRSHCSLSSLTISSLISLFRKIPFSLLRMRQPSAPGGFSSLVLWLFFVLPSKHRLLTIIRPQQPVTDVRFYICAVPSKDVVELVHDGGGLWMQRGRGA